LEFGSKPRFYQLKVTWVLIVCSALQKEFLFLLYMGRFKGTAITQIMTSSNANEILFKICQIQPVDLIPILLQLSHAVGHHIADYLL